VGYRTGRYEMIVIYKNAPLMHIQEAEEIGINRQLATLVLDSEQCHNEHQAAMDDSLP
jgi:hypothetical protein